MSCPVVGEAPAAPLPPAAGQYVPLTPARIVSAQSVAANAVLLRTVRCTATAVTGNPGSGCSASIRVKKWAGRAFETPEAYEAVSGLDTCTRLG